MEKTKGNTTTAKVMKANLLRAEETRQKTIAELTTDAAKVQGEIQANQELQHKASKAGDVDATMRYLATIQELETRKRAILDVVSNLDTERFYTDAEVITTGNAIIADANHNLSTLTAKWERVASALVDVTQELCMAKQAAENELAEILAYHSVNRDEKVTANARNNIYSAQGLSAIQTIPNMYPVHDLLYLKVGEKANAMVTISNGGSVPEFVN